MSDWVIFAVIYVISLAWLLVFALRYKIFSDRLLEYNCYLEIIETGKPINQSHGLIAACPMVTVIPWFMHRILRINKLTSFEITPCFFYAMMPAFGYLIARNYLSVSDSLIASLFIFSHFYFVYYPNYGRVSIALGILSGVIWGLLTGNMIAASIFTVLLIISHYGTAHYTLFVLGGAWAVMLLTDYGSPSFTALSTVLVILSVGIWVWFNFGARGAGNVVSGFIKASLTGNSATLNSATEMKRHRFISMSSREGVVQAAFGKGFRYFSIPQRLEFFTSWAVVAAVCTGAAAAAIQIGGLYRLLVIFSMAAIILTLVIPHISVCYGIARVYFTSVTILAPCFIYGANAMATAIGIPGWMMSAPLAVFYMLCVSGVVHRVFRINKRMILKAQVKGV